MSERNIRLLHIKEQQIAQLEAENTKLKERVKVLEKELKTEINYHAGTENNYRAVRLRAALDTGKVSAEGVGNKQEE